MFTILTAALFIFAVLTGSRAAGAAFMVWAGIVAVKSIVYILRWRGRQK